MHSSGPPGRLQINNNETIRRPNDDDDDNDNTNTNTNTNNANTVTQGKTYGCMALAEMGPVVASASARACSDR